MRLYEYEGKELFRREGIPLPEGRLISSVTEANNIGLPTVVKAQILSGKRGKSGLIIPCKSEDELKSAVQQLLSKEVAGQKIEKVLVEQFLFDKSGEYYLSITYDTSTRSPVALVSKKGGMGVEDLAKE